MEFYSPKLKKIIIFFQKKHFFNISGGNFLSSKNKLYLKKFVMFFPKKGFSYISGNGTSWPRVFSKKVFSYVPGGNFRSSKNKKFIVFFFRFWGMVLSSP